MNTYNNTRNNTTHASPAANERNDNDETFRKIYENFSSDGLPFIVYGDLHSNVLNWRVCTHDVDGQPFYVCEITIYDFVHKILEHFQMCEISEPMYDLLFDWINSFFNNGTFNRRQYCELISYLDCIYFAEPF